MQDLNDLYYFARVVEHGGFAPAGRALGVPKSTLSRRIALLEERLKSRLLQRSTRHFGMTEVGEVYYRHCVAMIAEAEAAQEAIDNTSAEPRGMIRVTCPISLMFSSVAPIISRYLAAHPQVRVQLSATNRRVDVIEEGVDVALRVRFRGVRHVDVRSLPHLRRHHHEDDQQHQHHVDERRDIDGRLHPGRLTESHRPGLPF